MVVVNTDMPMPAEDGIKISVARIRNFRSLKDVDVTLDSTTVLIGENNSGKTSFLEALHCAIGAGRRTMDEDDVFIGPGEARVPRERRVTIDLLIRPVALSGETRDTFPEGSYWAHLWGRGVALDSQEREFVAIRTELKWNSAKGEYETERRFLLDWPDPADWENARINEIAGRVWVNHIEPISIYFMDAKRDIDDELHNRSSFWHRLIRDPGLSDEQIKEIERTLSEINEKIVQGSDVLSHIQRHLNEIGRTVPCDSGSVAITPLTRHLRDLSKGMDISFSTRGAQSFPLVRHGMGTRCLAALLIFRAYSVWRHRSRGADQVHSMLALEEPEAHLHPQAQAALFSHIVEGPGQRIISTHSPYIARQAELGQLRYFCKDGATTKVTRICIDELEEEDMGKIRRAVLGTRGDMLYARALILCSGETEEHALHIYAEAFLGKIPSVLGISIVGVGGDGKYLPFLRLASGLGMRWYICSDGEDTAVKDVGSALDRVGLSDMSSLSNVFILPDKHSYERYLVAEGYGEVIERMLDSCNATEDYVGQYARSMNGQKHRGGTVRDYTGDKGRERAIVDILSENKIRYAVPTACAITSLQDAERRIPKMINDLLRQIGGDLGWHAEQSEGGS